MAWPETRWAKYARMPSTSTIKSMFSIGAEDATACGRLSAWKASSQLTTPGSRLTRPGANWRKVCFFDRVHQPEQLGGWRVPQQQFQRAGVVAPEDFIEGFHIERNTLCFQYQFPCFIVQLAGIYQHTVHIP